MSVYRYEQIVVSGIDRDLRNEIAVFAEKIMGEEGPDYISSRFPKYKEILLARKKERISAIQYLHPFVSGNNYCCYLGPLLSTEGAFFSMFINWLKGIWPAEGIDEIYLAAEFYNPDLFLFFKTIFNSYSFPHAGAQLIPEKVLHITSLFTQHIDHIQELDPHNLSTACNGFSCSKATRHPELNEWLSSRNVKIGEGRAQLLVVSLPVAQKKQVIGELEFYMDHPEAIRQKKNEVLETFNVSIA
jgi:hypothetical protein